jgi:hypothetical protein
MRAKKLSPAFTSVLAVSSMILLMTATRVAAQTETILHSFGNSGDAGRKRFYITSGATKTGAVTLTPS